MVCRQVLTTSLGLNPSSKPSGNSGLYNSTVTFAIQAYLMMPSVLLEAYWNVLGPHEDLQIRVWALKTQAFTDENGLPTSLRITPLSEDFSIS